MEELGNVRLWDGLGLPIKMISIRNCRSSFLVSNAIYYVRQNVLIENKTRRQGTKIRSYCGPQQYNPQGRNILAVLPK